MKLYNKLKSYFGSMRYYIGFLDEDDLKLPVSERYEKIAWLKENDMSEGWFADPFILNSTEAKVQVFVEEWVDSVQKGRLCLLDIEKTHDEYSLIDKHIILELDTHLSFPIFIKEHGKTYVYPENYQSGHLSIYEYDEDNYRLLNPTVIIEAPLVDTAIIKMGNMYYAFGTLVRDKSLEDTRFTYVYSSEYLLSGWKLMQVIENKRREERGAGAIFFDGDRFIRPAQNCVNIYGQDVVFYEIRFENGIFKEYYISRLEPDHSKYRGISLHTFNINHSLCVIDGQEYRRYRASRLLKAIF